MAAVPIHVDPTPLFDLSPWLYMQFMEPLGATDASVEAMWDHMTDDWKPGTISATRDLGPTLMRWGGCLSSYYRWREGIGPRHARVPMYNLLWGGIESNQIGLHEFVDVCRRTGAEPFYCINFESDGRMHWAHPPKGGVRSAGPDEAAAWVDYCNNPDHRERRENGSPAPFDLKLWQIGNETSYDPKGFDCDTAARRTVAFATAMRHVDPDLKLIGWGDSGWAPRMLDVAGEHLDYIAYHAGYKSTLPEPAPFADHLFRQNPEATWEHLMTGAECAERKLTEVEQQIAGYDIPIAITEGHYSRCGGVGQMLASWAAGVAYARIFNMYQRHGHAVRILTLSDFCGTRWLTNAMIVAPRTGTCCMLPVARVMQLLRRHTGSHAVAVTRTPADLDVTASRHDTTIFLHIVNCRRNQRVSTRVHIAGHTVTSGEISTLTADPCFEVCHATNDVLTPTRTPWDTVGDLVIPPAAVAALKLETNPIGRAMDT